MLVATRLHAALESLLEAQTYARDLDVDPWEFAVEIEVLRELGLNNSDFRWLLGRGLIEHAVENTRPGSDRTFEHPEHFAPTSSSCFIITHRGTEAATRGAIPGTPSSDGAAYRPGAAARASVFPPTRGQLRPTWNCTLQELSLGRRVVLRFKIPAADAEMILAVLEEAEWSDEVAIPQPLDQQPERVERAIALLNSLQRPWHLRFSEVEGAQIHWESASEVLEKTS